MNVLRPPQGSPDPDRSASYESLGADLHPVLGNEAAAIEPPQEEAETVEDEDPDRLPGFGL